MNQNNVIYMTYKSPVPRTVHDRWKNLNPMYNIQLSFDPECISFLKTHFNIYLATLFQKIKKGMYKADIWRLCKLYHHGGVYADVDLVPHLSIDTLDPTIFYSCLAADKISIFQAFMVNHAPKSPFMLCLLLSLILNPPYHLPNGPCHNMANCMRYMLNVPILEPYTEYKLDRVKIKVTIGPHKTPTKYIDLHYFPKDVPYQLEMVGSTPSFQMNIVDTVLIVTRIDKFEGWNTSYDVDICFDHSQTIYLFEEIVPPTGIAYAYVKDKEQKILDSRDLQYYTNGGW